MNKKKVIYGEYALLIALCLNSFGVELQVKSGFGVSCISSVSYALSHVFPALSFGTWNYLVQIFTLLALVAYTKEWKKGHLVSMGLSVAFGNLLDVYAAILPAPQGLLSRGICYCVGFLTVCFSVWMLQRCLLPILPFDEFTRDMSDFCHVAFRPFKTGFDVFCLTLTLVISLLGLGHLVGVGAGTFISAFCTGTVVAAVGQIMDQKCQFRLHRLSKRLA